MTGTLSLQQKPKTNASLGLSCGFTISVHAGFNSSLASILTLSLMQIENAGECAEKAMEGVHASIREGFRYVWNAATGKFRVWIMKN